MTVACHDNMAIILHVPSQIICYTDLMNVQIICYTDLMNVRGQNILKLLIYKKTDYRFRTI